MFKRIFYWGLATAALSTVACLIYNRIYQFAFEVDYSKLINAGSLVSINLLGCLLAAGGYGLITRWLPSKGEIVFNFAFTILSFGSIILPISISLPLDIQFPELFPGLTVPMHFFPAMAWYTLRPLFAENKT